jgi:hypothetical protein
MDAIFPLRFDLLDVIALSMSQSDLIQARKDMMAVLDEKFKNDREWRIFRAIDRALNGATKAESSESAPHPIVKLDKFASYVDLAADLIQRAGKPVSTAEIVSFVARQKERQPDEIKVNIQSALSRADRLQSVRWSGGRGWWLKGREVPER